MDASVFVVVSFFLPSCLSRPDSVRLSLGSSDSLFREGLLSEQQAAFQAFFAGSFCTSRCVMRANAEHAACLRLSAVFQPLAADTLTHISAVFFVLSPCSRRLAVCCTFAAHFPAVALMLRHDRSGAVMLPSPAGGAE